MLLSLLVCALSLGSLAQDTCDVRPLDEVEIVQPLKFKEVLPAQKLEGKSLDRMCVLSVADALHHFSGLQVRDYGGIGGIKTVNVRSMGSQHTGIYYDGIQLGNAQNGQIDLGQLSMDNVESVSVYHGQRSAILQSASDFGHSGSVYLRTRVPIFNKEEHHHLRFKLQYGSSDLLRISGLWEQRLSSRISLSFHAEALSASGRYKFRYRRLNLDHSVAYDTTATRQNGDVQSLLAEANLHGRTEGGLWHLKGYTYQSNRGIPGAIVNNVWRRGERQGDGNTFVQGQWQQDLGERYTMRVVSKYGNYATHYLNRDSTQYMADHHYRQQEGYLSTSHVYALTTWWNLSAAYDYRFSHLRADIPLFQPTWRHQHELAIASAFDPGKFQIQASLLGTWSADHQSHTHSSSHYNQWSPACFARWSTEFGLSLHAFAKRSFRLPTFNDLYYTDMGNSMLRPETTTQYDAGLAYQFGSPSASLSLGADIYHHRVKDKIIAYPKGQQFRWTMLNLGRVDIKGLDLTAQGEYQWQQFSLGANLQYTYQKAVDVTSPADSYYKDQIPYVPTHSGSLSSYFDYGGWLNVAYSFTYVGQRYCQQENIPYNHLQPWYTSDIHLQYKHANYRWIVEVLNLLDQQYDVIINYPMPGRNFRISLCANF